MNGLMQYNPTPIKTRGQAIRELQAEQSGQMQNALLQMQMQNALAQQQERQQQNALMAQFRDSIPSPQMQASQTALMGGGGPTVANAQRMQPVDPRIQMADQAWRAGQMQTGDYMKLRFPQDEFENVAPGTVRINKRTNQPVLTVPKEKEEDKDVALLRLVHGDDTPAFRQALSSLAQKKTTHAPPVSVSYGAPMAGVDDKGNPVFFQPQKGGGAPAIVPGVRPNPKEEKALTEGQAKALNFSSRMIAADRVLAQMSRKGVEFTIPGSASNNVFGDVVNAISTPEQQQLTQAKRDFINATLRRESGAVISPDEFANAERQYFPVPGDSRVVREQKARNRRVAIEGIRADVPKDRQSEVERVSGAGSAPAANNDDPLGLRGGK